MKELLSIDDVARRLSVGSTYARELIYSRQIRSVKLGKRRLIAAGPEEVAVTNTARHAAPHPGDRKTTKRSASRAAKKERAQAREIRAAVEFAAFGLRRHTDVVEAVIRELVDLEFHRPPLCARLR